MRRLAFIAAALAVAAPAGAAGPPSTAGVVFDVQVRWTAVQEPSEAWIQVDGDHEPLEKKNGIFWAHIPAEPLLGRKATLHVAYPNGEAVLPIRLVPTNPRMRLNVHRASGSVACDFATMRRLKQSGGDYLERVVLYFDAKRLVRDWPSTCWAPAQVDAIDAWYRNAYLLARTAHIELDDEASAQWNRVRPPARLKSGEARYGLNDRFEIEQFEMSARMTELDYRRQLQLIQEGEFDEALAVNDAITETLAADETLAAAAGQAQGVTRRRLADDRAYIETLRTESLQ